MIKGFVCLPCQALRALAPAEVTMIQTLWCHSASVIQARPPSSCAQVALDSPARALAHLWTAEANSSATERSSRNRSATFAAVLCLSPSLGLSLSLQDKCFFAHNLYLAFCVVFR
jgi:hypothetical protein